MTRMLHIIVALTLAARLAMSQAPPAEKCEGGEATCEVGPQHGDALLQTNRAFNAFSHGGPELLEEDKYQARTGVASASAQPADEKSEGGGLKRFKNGLGGALSDVKDKLGGALSHAKDGAGGTLSDAKEKMEEVGGTAVKKVKRAGETANRQIRGAVGKVGDKWQGATKKVKDVLKNYIGNPARTPAGPVYDNLDGEAKLDGNTVGKSKYKGSPEDCMDACNDQTDCNSFIYFLRLQECKLKDRVLSSTTPTKEDSDNRIWDGKQDLLNGRWETISYYKTGWIQMDGEVEKEYAGQTVGDLKKGLSPGQCMASCDSEEGCKSVLVKKNGDCLMKDKQIKGDEPMHKWGIGQIRTGTTYYKGTTD